MQRFSGVLSDILKTGKGCGNIGLYKQDFYLKGLRKTKKYYFPYSRLSICSLFEPDTPRISFITVHEGSNKYLFTVVFDRFIVCLKTL
jgi:hypothetical protein